LRSSQVGRACCAVVAQSSGWSFSSHASHVLVVLVAHSSGWLYSSLDHRSVASCFKVPSTSRSCFHDEAEANLSRYVVLDATMTSHKLLLWLCFRDRPWPVERVRINRRPVGFTGDILNAKGFVAQRILEKCATPTQAVSPPPRYLERQAKRTQRTHTGLHGIKRPSPSIS
jgi:hypothetical protein